MGAYVSFQNDSPIPYAGKSFGKTENYAYLPGPVVFWRPPSGGYELRT
jgi:hypothetical protein